jgi:hypothetical protein
LADEPFLCLMAADVPIDLDRIDYVLVAANSILDTGRQMPRLHRRHKLCCAGPAAALADPFEAGEELTAKDALRTFTGKKKG